jgi:hypothetical protein
VPQPRAERGKNRRSDSFELPATLYVRAAMFYAQGGE